ncbi:MAG: hypothetical protein OEZ23_02495, partial [Gammaproteobacteria bacterium]|nr:hypothetical protein [Gammaproteobacteria bacterium]
AEEVAEAIRKHSQARTAAASLPDDIAASAVTELLSRMDWSEGGFGSCPKFPGEPQLLLLLDQCQRQRRSVNHDLFRAVELSLDKMARGGIHDQVAGGFHRYTVDRPWLTPHFEKMLYNQAQLLMVYTQGFEVFGKREYERVSEEIVEYVTRDLTSDEGLFYSATDADSEGEEGLFFIWRREELQTALEPDLFELAIALFNVTEEGNFEGQSILHLGTSLEAHAERLGMDLEELLRQRLVIRQALYHYREQRVHPLRDEKIILAWNAMMINALLEASVTFGRRQWFAMAQCAAELLWQRCYKSKGENDGLMRIWMQGRASIVAGLEDYATLAEVCLKLYLLRDNGDVNADWLGRGTQLVEEMVERFYDKDAGGFYMTRNDLAVPLIIRPKSPIDGAMPSANAMALSTLVQLVPLTRDDALRERLRMLIARTIACYSGLMQASPSGFCYLIRAVDAYRMGRFSCVQTGGGGHLRASLEHLSGNQLRLTLILDDGWSIYAQDNPGAGLPCDLVIFSSGETAGGQLLNVQWPEPVTGSGRPPMTVTDTIASIAVSDATESDRIEDEENLVYTGRFEICFEIDKMTDTSQLSFSYQACSENLCLQQETLRFWLSSRLRE